MGAEYHILGDDEFGPSATRPTESRPVHFGSLSLGPFISALLVSAHLVSAHSHSAHSLRPIHLGPLTLGPFTSAHSSRPIHFGPLSFGPFISAHLISAHLVSYFVIQLHRQVSWYFYILYWGWRSFDCYSATREVGGGLSSFDLFFCVFFSCCGSNTIYPLQRVSGALILNLRVQQSCLQEWKDTQCVFYVHNSPHLSYKFIIIYVIVNFFHSEIK